MTKKQALICNLMMPVNDLNENLEAFWFPGTNKELNCTRRPEMQRKDADLMVMAEGMFYTGTRTHLDKGGHISVPL